MLLHNKALAHFSVHHRLQYGQGGGGGGGGGGGEDPAINEIVILVLSLIIQGDGCDSYECTIFSVSLLLDKDGT